jgi:hypothetical protein
MNRIILIAEKDIKADITASEFLGLSDYTTHRLV